MTTLTKIQSIGTSYREKLDFISAKLRLKHVVNRVPLQLNTNLSREYDCKVFLKREDLQLVRSYKIRGAYNLISSLTANELECGVVCASAGNHAQGFAYCCSELHIKGIVFMPVITPRQKIEQTRKLGGDFIEIILTGDTYDDCAAEAKIFTDQNGMIFIPAFDNIKIIEGQATIADEILSDLTDVDYLFVPIGGGGLISGVGSYFKTFSPHTQIVGLEPAGAPSMKAALDAGQPVTLQTIDRFVDGAAVKRVGDINYAITKEIIDHIAVVPEGRICSTILKLYNNDAIVVEPAGALSIAGLENFRKEIKGKNVVCIVSGSNNDIDRMQEIKERSLQYEGLKHYFLINFAQRPGALKEFVNEILGAHDDITRFEYMQKTNKEYGPALVGIELQRKEDYSVLLEKLKSHAIDYNELNKDDTLFSYLV